MLDGSMDIGHLIAQGGWLTLVEGTLAVGGVVKLVGGGLGLGFPEALSTVRNQGLALG
jgi:hypothetical protein